jgi:hypothetical protein
MVQTTRTLTTTLKKSGDIKLFQMDLNIFRCRSGNTTVTAPFSSHHLPWASFIANSHALNSNNEPLTLHTRLPSFYPRLLIHRHSHRTSSFPTRMPNSRQVATDAVNAYDVYRALEFAPADNEWLAGAGPPVCQLRLRKAFCTAWANGRRRRMHLLCCLLRCSARWSWQFVSEDRVNIYL